jgi:hypothetical protein
LVCSIDEVDCLTETSDRIRHGHSAWEPALTRCFAIGIFARTVREVVRELISAGNVDADGTVLAVNCCCFYTDDKGTMANPTGALWRVLPADKVPAGAELAKAK